MKQFVLMHKKTGNLGCGIRFNCFDNDHETEVPGPDGYRVFISSNEPDAWAIQVKDSAWIMVNADIAKGLEVLGEL